LQHMLREVSHLIAFTDIDELDDGLGGRHFLGGQVNAASGVNFSTS
jgi:hypothetical protein